MKQSKPPSTSTGNAYQLEESGYRGLGRAYLESAGPPARGQSGQGRDQSPTSRRRELRTSFRAVLGRVQKPSWRPRMVEAIIGEMGPVQDATDDAGRGRAAPRRPDQPPEPVERATRKGRRRRDGKSFRRRSASYKINEGAMIGGVCNGPRGHISTSMSRSSGSSSPSWPSSRGGVAALVYLVMMVLIPSAHHPRAEKAARFPAFRPLRRSSSAAPGRDITMGMKTFRRQARPSRMGSGKFKQDMRRGWRAGFSPRDAREFPSVAEELARVLGAASRIITVAPAWARPLLPVDPGRALPARGTWARRSRSFSEPGGLLAWTATYPVGDARSGSG